MFSFLNKAAMSMSATLLAEKAVSPEAFSNGISSAIAQKATIEQYFNRYGSTEKKFEFHPKPGFYIGFVAVNGSEEFLSVVIIKNGGSILSSFHPDVRHGQDVLGLMGKKAFHDQVAASFVKAAG